MQCDDHAHVEDHHARFTDLRGTPAFVVGNRYGHPWQSAWQRAARHAASATVGRALWMVLALLIATVGCRMQPPVSAPHTPAADPQTILPFIEKWRQAWEVRSVDGLRDLYVDNAQLHYVDQGAVLMGWAAVASELRERFARAKEMHVAVTEVQTQAWGTTVWVTAKVRRERSDGVTNVVEQGVTTWLLVSHATTWQIVAEHFSFRG